jgi:ribonuclease P protein component
MGDAERQSSAPRQPGPAAGALAGPARPRIERLKKRADYLRIAAGRNSASRPGLVLQALRRSAPDADGPVIRFGLTASRKVGGAVERNRARRRLRAAAEMTLPRHAEPGVDYVLIGRRGTLTRPFHALVQDLCGALRQTGCWRADDEQEGA